MSHIVFIDISYRFFFLFRYISSCYINQIVRKLDLLKVVLRFGLRLKFSSFQARLLLYDPKNAIIDWFASLLVNPTLVKPADIVSYFNHAKYHITSSNQQSS